MSPQIFNGDESSEDADSWLRHIIDLFDRVQYDDVLRLSLATFQLRKSAEHWWRGASRTLEETGVEIIWDSFCVAFRQEYIPESYVNAREREFDHLEQGTMSVREYARRFSSLLAYVPHVAGRERAKRTKFLEGLNEELYILVLSSKPKSYAEAVDSAIDIEEGLRSRRSRSRPQGAQGGRPSIQGVQSSQSAINPSSSHSSSWPSSQDFRGSDLVVISLRRSLVLVILGLVALVAVVLGQSFVASVEASIRRLSVLACRARVTSVVSMGTMRECVRQLDHIKPQPHLRVEEDRIGVVPLSFHSLWLERRSLGRSSWLVRRFSDNHLSSISLDPNMLK
ncbi:hypothetical protein F511_20798 [Dorcoceras hygrometricum]|uniref:Retrotransposon gag domain-containing protein n=1 Tax=Dorcoceras hygrometricum TaxID=472368 RepID=A0A2Z7B8A1_9LAMI|nr:hypothetical protein F511_20798 [Dorcoceras hygrometricum]